VTRTRLLRFGLAGLGIGLGLVLEWVFYSPSLGLELTVADFAVGCVLFVCGGLAWDRRPASRIGALMILVGFSWFAGNFGGVAVYLHRGPLVQVVLSYPTGRLRGGVGRIVVVAAYVGSVVGPLARSDVLTLALAVSVAAAAFVSFGRSSGPARRAGASSLAAALAYAAALALAAAGRLDALGHRSAVLWVYDAVIAAVAIVLTTGLIRSRWGDATVRGLVVDLGAVSGRAGLRARLASALGDPSLALGYRLDSGGFVDDSGATLAIPGSGSGRTVTRLEHRGEEIGLLVHDETVAADRSLVDSVTAAAQIAMANVRLQSEARRQATELEASRRRIVETTDRQRRRLEEELRLGPQRILMRVSEHLAAAGRSDHTGSIVSLEGELAEARQELQELAQGIRPAVLTEGGLLPALELLARRSALPVRVTGRVPRLRAPIEAALYFVCAEALANAVKHASASRVAVELRDGGGCAELVLTDDGVGGASIAAGTGLRGLADRLEALGGSLELESPPGGGTRLTAAVGGRTSRRAHPSRGVPA
jgi:signal transduction histidine kinase